MPIISVPQLDKKILCKKNESLMLTLQKNEVPVASSCLGDGICGKCLLEVTFSGPTNQYSQLETQLKTKNKWTDKQRASCQITVTADLTVHSTYW